MSLHVFNNSEKMINSIPNKNLVSVMQDQELNKLDTLTVEVPLSIWDRVEEKAFYIAVKHPDAWYKYQMYKVTNVEIQNDTVLIKSIDRAHDDLKAQEYIKDKRFYGVPFIGALEAIVEGTEWEIGYVDKDIGNIHTNFYYISRLEALGKLLKVSNTEVRFEVVLNRTEIGAKRINIYKSLSRFKGKRFVYGSDLLEIVKEEDTTELYTALVGRGKGEQLEDEDGNPIDDAYGRKVSFKEVDWRIADGDPVDKPKGHEHVELPDMTELYGYANGKPRMGIAEFNDIEDPEELLQATYEALRVSSRPKVQFKATVETAGDMELGETVAIIRQEHKLRYKTRIFKVSRDLLNNRHTEVEFGDRLTQTLGERIGRIDQTIEDEIDNVKNTIIDSADGKNKNFHGPDKPIKGMIKGDLWFKELPNGETEVYRYDGDKWVLIIGAGINQEIEDALDKADEDIKDAQEQADQTKKDADSILAGLGIKDIEDTHYEIVQGVKDNVIDKIGDLDLDIENFSGSLNARLDDLVGNIEGVEGEFSNFADKIYVEGKVDKAKGEITRVISGIKENPEETITGYNSMKSTVDGNFTDIGLVTTKANSNESKYNKVSETVNGIEREIGVVKETANNNTSKYNKVTETVDGMQREIGEIIDTPDKVINGYNIMRSTVEGNVSEIASVTQTANSNTARVNTVTETADGIEREIKNVRLNPESTINGFNTIKRTAEGNTNRISNIINTPSSTISGYQQVKETSDQYTRIIGGNTTWEDGTAKDNFARMIMGNSIFKTEVGSTVTDEVGNQTAGLKSSVTQLEGSWALRINSGADLVTQINATRKGLYLAADKITLDGDTVVDGSFRVTGEMIAGTIRANKIYGGTINGNNVTINNLDAGNISTGKLTGIEADIGVGRIGDWRLDNGMLSSQVNSGVQRYTTLKATGGVALGLGSPERHTTTNANLQIWHNGRLRWDNGVGLIESEPDGLVISSSKYVHIHPTNTLIVDGRINPRHTNRNTLGSTDKRWTTVYTTNGVNETSDDRLKSMIQDPPNELLEYLVDVKPKVYEMDGTFRFGYIAQDVERALYKYALKTAGREKAWEYAKRFNMLEKSESYMSLVYSELSVLKDAYNNKRLEAMEDRLSKLEGMIK